MNRTAFRAARTGAIAGVAAFGVLGIMNSAVGLWSDTAVRQLPAMSVGSVQFGAQPYTAEAVVYSTGLGKHLANGSPVTVTLPGAEIAKVIDGPTTWRFRASGYADGIAGMEYDISYPAAAKGTLLDGSTMRVFKASNGDCSTVPADQPDLTGVVLQESNANPAGSLITDEWCVSIAWNYEPDGLHVNNVVATATGVDGTKYEAYDQFNAFISYPVSLKPKGIHQNTALAQGTGDDGSIVRATDMFDALIFPDPTKEPSMPITLTPRVTSLNPDFLADPQ